MSGNRLDKWDRENLREYVEAMSNAGRYSVSVAISEVLGLLDDLDKVPALVEAYRDLHARTCDDYWDDDECACGGRQLLAFWKGIA